MTADVLLPALDPRPGLRWRLGEPALGWREREPRLFAFGLLMLVLMLPAGLALGLDDRTLRGVNVWIKPLKFMAAFVAAGLQHGLVRRAPRRCRSPRPGGALADPHPHRDRWLRGGLHHAAGGAGPGLALPRR